VTVKFVANLRDRTIEAFGRHGIQPAAYLLSTHRITPAALNHAHDLRDDGIPIMADNGSKELIDQVIATFREPAREVWERVRDIRHAVGHTPRGQEVPPDLRRDASTLAHKVVAFATELSEQVDSVALLDAQLSMRATHLIAQEDFAVACLLALNLERETTGWPVRSFETRNRRSLRLWQRVMEDRRVSDRRVYAVLSAADYNTARAAGRLAADAGVDHVAIGCAGFMLDRTAVDFYTLGTANFRLRQPAARRYVRFTQAIAGIRDGFAEAGGTLQSIHTLGLGAPALFPVFAAAAPADTALTTDATSPIHDAVRDRVLYDPVDHGRRLTTQRIVGRVLDGKDWTFTCPFCADFRRRFGHDPDGARDAWKEAGVPTLDRSTLQADGDLATALPLFAGPDPERAASRTHIAHNHWVVGELSAETPVGASREAWALRRIEALMDGASAVTDRGLGASQEVLGRLSTR
jgi:hypothetical protein